MQILKGDINTIFFDVDDVLLEPSTATDAEFCQILNTDSDTFIRIRNELYADSELHKNWVRVNTMDKEIEYYREFYRLVMEKLQQLPDEIRIDNIMEIRYKNKLARKLYPGVSDLLAYLKNNYRLGIITNANPSRREIELKHLEISRYFDPIVISCEVGCMKPDAGIYQLALRLACTSPHHAAFVDNKIENVTGAVDTGFGMGICIGEKTRASRNNIVFIDNVTELKEIF